MTPFTPFRFAVSTRGAESARAWTALAREAESRGYELLTINDHLRQPFAPLVALAAAAAVTQTLRIGTYVLCQDLRNPVVLAHELATLDVLSDGRLEVGLGAGWLDDDYRRAGIAAGTGAERFERFQETFAVISGLLSSPQIAFTGRHHELAAAACDTRPLQSPHPPLLIGAARRKMLTFAAQHADVVSITPAEDASGRLLGADPPSLDERIGWVREAAGARARPPRIDLVVWECLVTPRPAPVLDALARAMSLTPVEVAELPCVLVGSVEQIVETLTLRRDRWGLSSVTIPAEAMAAMTPVVERLAGR